MTLDDELARVMLYARQEGLRKALAWIAKRQAERERARTPKRKRKARLPDVPGGTFWIDPEVLKDGEQ